VGDVEGVFPGGGGAGVVAVPHVGLPVGAVALPPGQGGAFRGFEECVMRH
jgi:hypothetical protein